MMKKWLSFLLSLLLLLCVSCSGEPTPGVCVWCGAPTTHRYAAAPEHCYVCDVCRRQCMICEHKPATRHFTCDAGLVVFACDACFKEMAQTDG